MSAPQDATPEWEVLAGGKNRRLTTGKEGSDASISASWGSLEVIPPLRRAAKEPAIAQAAPAQAAPAPAPAAKAAQAPAPSATAAKSTAVVHFRVKCETALGEQVSTADLCSRPLPSCSAACLIPAGRMCHGHATLNRVEPLDVDPQKNQFLPKSRFPSLLAPRGVQLTGACRGVCRLWLSVAPRSSARGETRAWC